MAITVEHSDATPKELFDSMRALIENEGLLPQQCGERLGIPPGRARMIWHKVQAQIAIDSYGIDSREIRAKYVRSAMDRIMIENASSDEPERQKLALQAAKLIMQDPFTGIMDSNQEPDWDNIKTIGSGEVKVEDVIAVSVEKP